MSVTKKNHPVDERLPINQLFLYGLQHVLAMYAGAVAVPLILANALGLGKEQLIYLINADLFTCGIATLIQTLGFWKMGIKIPVIQGVTFAAVTPMILIGKSHGLTGIYGSVMIAGIITYLASPYFSRLIRFFPPVVTGSIITIIGVSLLPVAVRWAGGGVPSAKNFGDIQFIGLAFLVLALVVFFYRYFKGFLSNIAVLLGLAAGTLIALPLGLVNFSGVSNAALIGITTPFAFGMPIFDIPSIVAMTLVMLVVMTETTGDFIAIGEIVDKPISQEDLTRGLRADGFSTLLGGILNAFPYTAYAQNVGLVGLTRVKSRYVVAAAGAILVILGLFPKAAAVVASIPTPVLGGAGIAMFGMVMASGIKTLSKIDFDNNHNLMVVAVSVAVGLIPLAVPSIYQKFPEALQVILNSGITVGSVVAIVLNAILNKIDTVPYATNNKRAN
ncbi:nucleobase:cation symporter-2 family protein [Pelosinus sp. UFO1]|uniref:nucleobase:cation symporter-2 family protein n=1 Tax=Pelosinus sp. UFO1 TaxID=484770 RepID=UPI0004D1E855|nr:nucleobase:cation symporter-2 family protein [Pelosinus sp. UFO1]AIF50356.1 xanthine permease [Pelosinus sp. UFO1]